MSEERLPQWRRQRPARQHQTPPPTPLKLRGGPRLRRSSLLRSCAGTMLPDVLNELSWRTL